ncbi:MAG: metal-binding protein [Chloroflexota bacterium]|nr:metal-binding protein [Chloroflexota bacterium]
MVSSPVAAAAAFVMGYPPLGVIGATALVGLGSVLGILFTPDLDIDHRSFVERLPILGWPWFIIWLPYAKALPHRSIHSHLPVWGTCLRQLYFVSLIWLLGSATGLEQASLLQFWTWLLTQWWYWWLLLGLLVSDIAHWLRDTL